MKNLLLSSILICLFSSCSNDSDLFESENNTIDPTSFANDTLTLAENNKNPLDYKGKQYYQAIMLYRGQNQFPHSATAITTELNFVSQKLYKGKNTGKSIIAFNDSIVESIMADPDAGMIAIVQSSLLGSGSKTSLINFLQGLIGQRQLTFSSAYDYIVSYEDTVLQSNIFSGDDADTILTVTSISRYSLYSESERKDKDWDTSAGNKTVRNSFTGNQVALISVIAILDSLL